MHVGNWRLCRLQSGCAWSGVCGQEEDTGDRKGAGLCGSGRRCRGFARHGLERRIHKIGLIPEWNWPFFVPKFKKRLLNFMIL